jgi:hypothetical protein
VTRPFVLPKFAVLALSALTLAPVLVSHVQAQSDADEAPLPAERAAAAVDDGAFLPQSMSARSDAQRALVSTQGGYDTAQRSPQLSAAVQAQVLGRISLRAGASYAANGASQAVHPEVSLKVDALRQESAGFDLAAAAGYEANGFNTTPAVTLRIAAARTIGRTKLLANVGFGVALEQGERYGDLRLAAMQRILPDMQLGLDSRFRIDLERDHEEPAGEAEWDLTGGPCLAYNLSRFVLSASAGPSALKLRFADSQVGISGMLGLGAVF